MRPRPVAAHPSRPGEGRDVPKAAGAGAAPPPGSSPASNQTPSEGSETPVLGSGFPTHLPWIPGRFPGPAGDPPGPKPLGSLGFRVAPCSRGEGPPPHREGIPFTGRGCSPQGGDRRLGFAPESGGQDPAAAASRGGGGELRWWRPASPQGEDPLHRASCGGGSLAAPSRLAAALWSSRSPAGWACAGPASRPPARCRPARSALPAAGSPARRRPEDRRRAGRRPGPGWRSGLGEQVRVRRGAGGRCRRRGARASG